MNCPMFKTVGVGGQMSHPCTLSSTAKWRGGAWWQDGHTLGLRHQWCDTLVPGHFVIQNALDHQLQPACCGVNCFRVSSSLLMSRQYVACCPRLPPAHSSPPPAKDLLPLSPPNALCGRPAYVEFGNHLPMPCLDQVRPEPSLTGVAD